MTYFAQRKYFSMEEDFYHDYVTFALYCFDRGLTATCGTLFLHYFFGLHEPL